MEAWKRINWRYLCLSELNVSWNEQDMQERQKSGPNSKCNGQNCFKHSSVRSRRLPPSPFNVSTFRSWTSISNSDCWKQRLLADNSIVHTITASPPNRTPPSSSSTTTLLSLPSSSSTGLYKLGHPAILDGRTWRTRRTWKRWKTSTRWTLF